MLIIYIVLYYQLEETYYRVLHLFIQKSQHLFPPFLILFEAFEAPDYLFWLTADFLFPADFVTGLSTLTHSGHVHPSGHLVSEATTYSSFDATFLPFLPPLVAFFPFLVDFLEFFFFSENCNYCLENVWGISCCAFVVIIM